MGLSHRIVCRIYAAACRTRRRLALLPTSPAAVAFLQQRRRQQQQQQQQTPTSRLLLLGVSVVSLLVILPFSTRPHGPHLQEGAKRVCGAGIVALLTACIVWLYNIEATMDDRQPGGWRWQTGEDSEGDSCMFWRLGRSVLLRIRRRCLTLEASYLKMKNLSILINQMVFFSLCERLLLDQQKLASLYTLMCFNVVAYCVSYIKELVEREDWSMYINIARTSNVRHLALSTTNIVLEWTKAVTFIITIVFMLLVFGLEKGLKDYTPTSDYLALTAIYFTITEKVFTDMVGNWLDNRKFNYFESLESLYWPTLLLTSHLALSSVLTLICALTGNLRIVLLATLINIRFKYKELRDSYLMPLQRELATLSAYRCATQSEVRQYDDICAVCLAAMTSARVTPCQHFFHADCLRHCLRESYRCPICQYNLSQSTAGPTIAY